MLAALALLALPAHGAIVCGVNGASLALGAYTGDSSTPADSIGSVTVTCSRDAGNPNVAVTLGIGPSLNSGSVADRKLRQVGGNDLLRYNVYVDPLRQTVWGESAGVNAVTQSATIPNKSTVTLTYNLYGRIPGNQDVFQGRYTDSLVMTISY